MKYDSPFVEMECCQLTKDGQAACGDDFQWLRLENENRNIAVLSDGLGSGIKAPEQNSDKEPKIIGKSLFYSISGTGISDIKGKLFPSV